MDRPCRGPWRGRLPLALLALCLPLLAGCGAVQVESGPPVAGTTPSTFNPSRREAVRITQESPGIPIGIR